VCIYNYYKLNFFLVLIVKFNQKSNFRSGWSELGLIRPELAPNEEKTWFSRVVSGIIFYVQVLLINLVPSLNLKVY